MLTDSSMPDDGIRRRKKSTLLKMRRQNSSLDMVFISGHVLTAFGDERCIVPVTGNVSRTQGGIQRDEGDVIRASKGARHLSEGGIIMRQSIYAPSLARPPCARCGQQLWLARIEPGDKPSHDLRTFECTNCKTSEIMEFKFK